MGADAGPSDSTVSWPTVAGLDIDWRAVCERLQEGFFIGEVIRDGQDAPDYRYLHVNPAFERLTGRPCSTVQGLRAAELVPVSDEIWRRAAQQAVDQASSVSLCAEVKAWGRSYDAEFFPLGGDRFGCIFSEVTEGRQREQELRISEAAFRASQELSQDGFTILRAVRDGAGRVVDFIWDYANPAARRGLSAEDRPLVGERLSAQLPETFARGGILERFKAALEGRSPAEIEVYLDMDGVQGWFRHALTRIDADRIGVSFRNITAERDAERALKESEANARERLQELEVIYEAAPVGLAFLDPELRFVRINRWLAEMNGLAPADHIGRTIHDVVPAIGRQVDRVVERVLQGEATVVEEITGDTVARPGVTRHWLGHWSALRDREGALRGLNVVVEDITERKQTFDRRKLLLDELAHRLKNTLAMVQSIARQTFRGAEEAERVREFEQRLEALGAAHSLLTENAWESVDLAELIRAALGIHLSDRISLDGPAVDLPASACANLALAIHELETNATKYGALSGESGVVRIRWRLDRLGVLTLRWDEKGGPPVAPPTRRGFGSRLLHQAFTPGGGTVELIYHPTGLSAHICLPLPTSRPAQTV